MHRYVLLLCLAITAPCTAFGPYASDKECLTALNRPGVPPGVIQQCVILLPPPTKDQTQ